MAFVEYNGKKIVPAPFISVSKSYTKTAGGTTIPNHPGIAKSRQGNIIGATYNIEISGTLVASMLGSPKIDGNFYSGSDYPNSGASQAQPEQSLDSPDLDKQRFNKLMKMQASLRHLFAEDGFYFEIDDGLGGEVFKCIVDEVSSIQFTEAARGANWTDRCEYSISFRTDRILSSGHPLCPLGEDFALDNLPKDKNGDEIYLDRADESWSLDPQEEGSDENSMFTAIVSHDVSAVGKRVYSDAGSGTVSSEAWEEAKKWVDTKLRSSAESLTSHQKAIVVIGTQDVNLSDYNAYNRMRSEQTDELSGSYSVRETWLLSKENTIESFNLSLRTSTSSGLTTISLDGNIRGLDDNTDIDLYNKTANPGIKYTNAKAKFAAISFYSRASLLTPPGITLNPTVLSKSESHNRIGGTISYTYEYDNRALNCLTDARTENITINFSGGGDVFAIIPVIGKFDGPVMQDINTIKEKVVNISIDAVMDIPTTYVDATTTACDDMAVAVCTSMPDTDSLLDSLRDEAVSCRGGTDQFKQSDNESWNFKTGRYTRNASFVIKTCDPS